MYFYILKWPKIFNRS